VRCAWVLLGFSPLSAEVPWPVSGYAGRWLLARLTVAEPLRSRTGFLAHET